MCESTSRRVALALATALCSVACAQDAGVVDFDVEAWDLDRASPGEHLGRAALCGRAILRDVEFGDGVIEVDIAVSGARSYPGIVLRQQSAGLFENIYLRPHRAGLYADALQYCPVYHGEACWQLFHGDGFTAPATVPLNEWVRLRVEVRGTQARVFLGADEQPALEIPDLKLGNVRGAIGVQGPCDGTAWFSNFRYTPAADLEFDEPPPPVLPKGMLTEWEISRPFPADGADLSKYPDFFQLFAGQWRSVEPESNGLINISRHVERPRPGRYYVAVRTALHCERNRNVRLTFGYSDDVTLFLNGQAVYSGINGYRSRDGSYVGAVGLFDTVHLTLPKGRCELMLLVADSFGGWGFMCRLDRAVRRPDSRDDLLTKVWETPAVFKVPESVLFDPGRGVLYVTSFNKVGAGKKDAGFISKVGLDGEIVELEWITGLDGPCGMALRDGHLFVCESSGNLVEIDVEAGRIVARYPAEGAAFLNDVAADDAGNVYVSNSSRAPAARDIYVLRDKRLEVWIHGDEIYRANGLFVHDGHLVVGANGDGQLKRIRLSDGVVTNIASMGGGIIDGIRVDPDGNYLVSHWGGQTYRVTPAGRVTRILDTQSEGLNSADFEFLADQRLLVVPTFLGNSVVAYRLADG